MNINSSFKASFIALACLSAALPGCAVHNGPDGESALWTTTKKASTDAKDLKDPIALNLAYARWQEQLGQINDARQAYEFVLTDDPKSTDAVLGLARIDQLAGRSMQAEAGIQKALKMKPEDPHVLHSAGQFYATKSEWPKAIELLNKAMTLDKQNDTYRYSYAVALASAGHFEESLPHFIATVGEASAQYNIGYILYEQGRLAEAEQHLAAAVKKRPELKQAHVILAQVRKARKDEMIAAAAKRSARHPVSNADASVTHSNTAPQRQPVQQTAGVRASTWSDPNEAPRNAAPNRIFEAPIQSSEIEDWADRK